MSPKEFAFVCKLIEDTAKAAYTHGHGEGLSGKPLDETKFRMSEGNKLTLKKELNTATKSR